MPSSPGCSRPAAERGLAGVLAGVVDPEGAALGPKAASDGSGPPAAPGRGRTWPLVEPVAPSPAVSGGACRSASEEAGVAGTARLAGALRADCEAGISEESGAPAGPSRSGPAPKRATSSSGPSVAAARGWRRGDAPRGARGTLWEPGAPAVCRPDSSSRVSTPGRSSDPGRGNCDATASPTSSVDAPAAFRARVARRGRSSTPAGSSMPVARRIWLTRSDFRARLVGLEPKACAMAKSSSRSLASKTERSSCNSLIYYLIF